MNIPDLRAALPYRVQALLSIMAVQGQAELDTPDRATEMRYDSQKAMAEMLTDFTPDLRQLTSVALIVIYNLQLAAMVAEGHTVEGAPEL